jgi:hypothetical protein
MDVRAKIYMTRKACFVILTMIIDQIYGHIKRICIEIVSHISIGNVILMSYIRL